MSRPVVPPFELTPYQYDPLPKSNSFRLLSLLPERLNQSKVTICGQPLISCLLRTVDLDHVPIYNALSYTWGNPRTGLDERYDATHKWPISVNGRLLYITKNLHEALQQLPQSDYTNEGLNKKRAPYDKTLLIEAAEAGYGEEVKNLILQGASLHGQDRFGETALHYAAENGHLEVVKLLLQHGADKSILDSARRTPIECCLQQKRGQWESVKSVLTQHRSEWSTDQKESLKISQIWIDAICIDQTNVEERNSQVAMMSHIYGHASQVVVWLGVMDQDTVRESETMGRLSNHDDWKALDMSEQEVINNLLRRHTWFQRKWVAQELVLAQNVKMYSGDCAFDWELLARVALLNSHYIVDAGPGFVPTRTLKYGIVGKMEPGAWVLSQLRSVANPDVQIAMRTELVGHMEANRLKEWHNMMTRLRSSFENLRPSLSQLVIMTWGLDATDPRDKIFALTSMARSTDPTSLVPVNYHKPAHQVFQEMGRIFVQAQEDASMGILGDMMSVTKNDMGPLEGLSFVQPAICARYHVEKGEQPCAAALGLLDLPTWVPNFDRKLVSVRFYDPRFNACGPATYKSHNSDPKLLKVDALFVDEITTVERLPPENTAGEISHGYGERYSVNSWLRTIMAVDPVYNTGEDRLEVLWRTLIANQIESRWQSQTPNAPERDITTLRRSFKYFICKALSPRYTTESLDRTMSKTLETLRETDLASLLPTQSEIDLYDEETSSNNQASDLFMYTLALYVHIRALFTTKLGYVGNGFNIARPGDQVWLLAGARVPFLLREVPGTNRFELVGEAYVHGLMQGEAIKDSRVDQFHPIEIQ